MSSKLLPSVIAKVLAALLTIALIAATAFIMWYRPPAPAAEYTTLVGERTSTRDLLGKVVYINFWATSCATCIKEMPDVVKTYERFAPRSFELLAVAMAYDPPAYVRNYVQQNRLPFKVVLDSQGAIAAAFDNVALTPTAVIIDKKGRLLRRTVGEPDFVALHALIDRELAE